MKYVHVNCTGVIHSAVVTMEFDACCLRNELTDKERFRTSIVAALKEETEGKPLPPKFMPEAPWLYIPQLSNELLARHGIVIGDSEGALPAAKLEYSLNDQLL